LSTSGESIDDVPHWFAAHGVTVERVMTDTGGLARKWLHLHNHHRAHTAQSGLQPASHVTNLSGQYNEVSAADKSYALRP